MATASVKTPPEERLVNLVVALTATDQGLTKDTILANVTGYREQREAGASKDALEKMFERDKENLRALGVPIETIGDWADPDDLREARYRVPAAEYTLPDDLEFSPAELALLTLAGSVWSESSMSVEARAG
ncbi:MAG TPA: WYL domain-containing protein, partial [Microbacterium sp.]|nr:WYL domain-containing protein [Microbacterium sp.]